MRSKDQSSTCSTNWESWRERKITFSNLKRTSNHMEISSYSVHWVSNWLIVLLLWIKEFLITKEVRDICRTLVILHSNCWRQTIVWSDLWCTPMDSKILRVMTGTSYGPITQENPIFMMAWMSIKKWTTSLRVMRSPGRIYSVSMFSECRTSLERRTSVSSQRPMFYQMSLKTSRFTIRNRDS